MPILDDELAAPTRAPSVHGRMLMFGLREGTMWHVKDVPNGKACGCVCPECAAQLEAKNNGKVRAAHFSHSSGADCAGGYETALHLAGKEALQRLKCVCLPEYITTLHAQAIDGKIFKETIHLETTTPIKADQAWEEVWLGRFRPDVVFEVNGEQLLIEIKVTHAVDEVKLAKIKEKGISAIEIDLSFIEPEALRDQASFDNCLVSDPTIRTWLHSRKIDKLEAEARARLRARVAVHTPEAQKIRAAERAWEQRKKEPRIQRKVATQQYRAEQPTKIQVARVTLAPHLEQLMLSQNTERMAAREHKLAERNSVPSLGRYEVCGVENLFVRVKGHWVFNATFAQWQSYILDHFYPIDCEPPKYVTLQFVGNEVESKFGVAKFIKELRKAVLTKSGRLALNVDEIAGLPRPTAVISAYLEHLCSLGLIVKQRTPFKTRSLRVAYEPLGSTLEKAHAAHVKATEAACAEKARKSDEACTYQDEYLERLRKCPTPHMEPHVADRVLAILASELWVFVHHAGKGRRCNTCHMVSPEAAKVCPFCRARGSGQPVRIDIERLCAGRHILPLSPGVAGSLYAAPILDLSDLQLFMGRLKTEC